ncbi:hypothetical protein [Nonomuraea rosea]|uniref:hypothetical protein n=1 Tax=Nonomuraea rosea TaxID=638574 RepID=UPI0031EEA9D2
MIERADQLVLNYVSKAADAAHGVLRADQRLDFARRLRARIEDERQGSQNARQVSKVLARFGDPVALVEREARRLADAAATARRDAGETSPDAAPSGGEGDGRKGAGPQGRGATLRFPAIADDRGAPPAIADDRGVPPAIADDRGAPPGVGDDGGAPPGVQAHRKIARQRVNRPQGRALPFAGLRRAAMSSANPMATGGRDARTIVKEHPRDTAALVLLLVAALLVPFDLPPVAIFEVPVLVWAAGGALVLLSSSWSVRDRLLGAGAPLLGYSVGGVVIGGLRVGTEQGVQAFFTQFFDVSGTMFMIGTGLGVVWLAYRLLDRS